MSVSIEPYGGTMKVYPGDLLVRINGVVYAQKEVFCGVATANCEKGNSIQFYTIIKPPLDKWPFSQKHSEGSYDCYD